MKTNEKIWENCSLGNFLFKFKGKPSQEDHKTYLRRLTIYSMTLTKSVLLPENLHTYFELSAQAWTLY